MIRAITAVAILVSAHVHACLWPAGVGGARGHGNGPVLPYTR